MSDKKPEFFLPPRSKPKPGSLPIQEKRIDPLDGLDAEGREKIVATWDAPPPWGGEPTEPLKPKKPDTTNLKKLKAARKKVQEYSAVLRTDAFDDWVRRCTQPATQPSEWTQASPLYESYLRHAKGYGANRPDKRLAKESLASVTAWGKMMGSLFPRGRRAGGNIYPLRLKRGA